MKWLVPMDSLGFINSSFKTELPFPFYICPLLFPATCLPFQLLVICLRAEINMNSLRGILKFKFKGFCFVLNVKVNLSV